MERLMATTAIDKQPKEKLSGISFSANSWFALAAAISAVFLVITVASPFLPDFHPAIDRLLELANLRAENNFAAWWSGILLIMSSVHAFDGWAMYRETNRRLANGWLSLALILAALSVDEVASLHERLSYFSAGMWRMLIPFALVFAGMFLITAQSFWRERDHRQAILGVSTAFFLFALVALQEFIEHAIVWPDAWLSVRAGFEEGTELVAMLILLKVTMVNSRQFFQQATDRPAASLEAPGRMRTPIVVAGIFVCPILALLTAALPDLGSRGNPSDWFASTTFLLAALVSLRNYRKGQSFPGILTAFACLVGSFAIVINPENTLSTQYMDIHKRLVVYLVVVAVVLADWWGGNRSRSGMALIFLTSVVALSVSYGATWNEGAAYYLLPQYIALVLFWFVGATPGDRRRSTVFQGIEDRRRARRPFQARTPVNR